MADLDIKTLGVTLASTSGTIALADGVYDETQKKSQNTINAELYAASAAAAGVSGVKSGDKVLSVTNKQLSSTLGLTYEKKTGDTAKKIYLTGIGGATIASIDTTDFTKDKFVKSAELVETAETGVTVEVPYIKIIFNDDTEAPIRFSVKSLVDTYTGANLKLSTNYASTTGATPASNVTLDAAMKNVATRVSTLEGKKHVDSIGGKTGAITLNSGATGNGEVNFGIDSNGKITAVANTTMYAYQTDLNSVNTALGDRITTLEGKKHVDSFNGKTGAVTLTNTTGTGGITWTTSTSGSITGAVNVSGLATTANALYSVAGASSSDGFVTVTAGTKASNKQTLTPSVKVVTTGSGINDSSSTSDSLASANAVVNYLSTYILPGINSNITTNKNNISSLQTTVTAQGNTLTNLSTAVTTNQKNIATNTSAISTLKTSVSTNATNITTNKNTISALSTTVVENYPQAVDVGTTTYDEWSKIIAG